MSATINNIAKIKQTNGLAMKYTRKQTHTKKQTKIRMFSTENLQNCKKISFPDKLSYGKLAGGGVFGGMDGEIYQPPNPNYWAPVKGAFLRQIHNQIRAD